MKIIKKLVNRAGANEAISGSGFYISYLFIALLISIFTFPKFFGEAELGLDGSEMFAFNYFFYHHIQLGPDHVFTYGPLGFIYYPLCMGNNLVTAIILSNAVRFIFIYSFLILGHIVNKSYRVLHIVLIIGFCNMMYFDMAFIGAPILAMLIYHARKEITWLICGSVMAALALLVKSSLGLMTISVLCLYAVYSIFATKRPYVILYITGFTTFFFLFIWFLLYHTISGVPGYLCSLYQLSIGNSNALQIEVVNHWGILCFSLIFFYIPILFTKNELTRILYLISSLTLYAAFKYSFAREENWHQTFLFTCMIMISAMFLLLNSNAKALTVMFLLAAISLLYANMVMTNTFKIDYEKRVTGIGNFIEAVINYDSVVKNVKVSDSLILRSKVLDGQQRALIGGNTVDCYPYEFNYIEANTLNWDPRPKLEIMSCSNWLDRNNASFLSSAMAPRFYIWELEQPPVNNYTCDTRYLLNEDPISTYAFFDHYYLACNNTKTALFEYSPNNLLGNEQIKTTTNGYLNKWLEVISSDSNSIIRARFHFINTFQGILRKTLYKDQLYFIDYMLENGELKSYRFIPENAALGTWINPLVIDITKGLKGEKVKNIRIRVSRSGCVDNNFLIDWTIFHVKH